MNRQILYFTAPQQVEIREEPLPVLQSGQLLVRTLVSGISAGTELLYYRGQVPQHLALDASIPALPGSARYPFPYGYASVGEVIAAGSDAVAAWVGRRVFSFQPHASHFQAALEELIPLDGSDPCERGVFLPNMETALNFVMDLRPLAGEVAGIFGLGVVGLLSAALLLRFPLGGLAGWDRYEKRRQAAVDLGLGWVLDPDDKPGWDRALQDFRQSGLPDGLDLALECSGAPQALNQAIERLGYGGRLVIGSWYGIKPVQLDLGGAFHRSRIELIASQVSTIAPGLRGRWTKDRRLAAALHFLQWIQPERWITHRFPLSRAAEAYQILSQDPAAALQVVFTY